MLTPYLKRALICSLALSSISQAQETQEKQTVTINANKPESVKKLDKTVHDLTNSSKAANGTAQDLLQAIPQVSVSADGKIAVNGNSQVTVLVDGKPSAILSGDERAIGLQTMSGADIASVEVITNPSAAYSTNGGAIINLVLKRDRKLGMRSQLRGSMTDQGLRNANLNVDYGQATFALHGSLGDRRDGNLKIRESIIDWQNPVDGNHYRSIQNSEVFVRRHVESASLGLDYLIDAQSSMSLSGRYNARRSIPLFDVLNQNLSVLEPQIFHRISVGPNQQSDTNLNWSYDRQSADSVFKASLQRSSTLGLIDKSYRDVFLEPVRATEYSRGTTQNARMISQANLDWSERTPSAQWGAGLDLQEKTDELYNHQAVVDFTNPQAPVEIIDRNTSNSYAVTTRLGAAYLTRKWNTEHWEILLGGRLEIYEHNLYPNPNRNGQHRWTSLNPSLNAQYVIDDSSNLSLSYRRSLQMPDARDLNPFTTYIDAQNVTRGNPSLKPQTVDVWEIGPDFTSDNLSGNLTAVLRQTADTVVETRSISDKLITSSRQNGGHAQALGLNSSLDWKPTKSIQLGFDTGFFQVELSTPENGIAIQQKKITSFVNLRGTYKHETDNLSLDAHWQSGSITPLGSFGATRSVNLAWKRQLSKTLSLTLNANDIFDGSKKTYQVRSYNFSQTGFDHFVARRIYVGFVKKFE
ncbi:TonB-dependent receptor [Undibacterium cyanobacteriorum]|uniref:TonB-dependent receptor n=1 Tax=Undibacterium cyanobacteriorum TaxID=3073561 RepID=A0ABY9REK2_9BURK|nr:TonB-dependent receptor [Undibacterium sp. 20NA77.5]WMW79656.1 TonB-dependent receptor [Undibacterium sp. 20NA77.5]